MSNYCIIYTTVEKLSHAERLAEDIVNTKMAACVNIIPGMRSVYRWEGDVKMANETVMMIKTERRLESDVIAEVKRLHPYETPAVITLPIEGGCPEYLSWISEETK